MKNISAALLTVLVIFTSLAARSEDANYSRLKEMIRVSNELRSLEVQLANAQWDQNKSIVLAITSTTAGLIFAKNSAKLKGADKVRLGVAAPPQYSRTVKLGHVLSGSTAGAMISQVFIDRSHINELRELIATKQAEVDVAIELEAAAQ